jgi:hypothetical protein
LLQRFEQHAPLLDLCDTEIDELSRVSVEVVEFELARRRAYELPAIALDRAKFGLGSSRKGLWAPWRIG